MEVEILQENLLKGVSAVSRFVVSRPSLPVLGMILIKTDGGKLSLSATNMDTGVEIKVGAKVEKEGGVVVPAKLMQEYVGFLPAGKVKLSVSGGVLELVASGRKAKITGMEAAEFPELPKIAGGEACRVAVADLEKVIKLVSFAASSDETRPVLSALLIKVKQGKMEVVATDGYRLSLIRGVAVAGKKNEAKVLVNARVVEELVRLAREEEGEGVEVVFGGEHKSVVFRVGAVVLTTRVIDGEYPAYEKIIPGTEEVLVEGNREEMLEAVRSTAIFARESSNIVKWEIGAKGLVMKANSAGLGEQESVVEVELKQGEGGSIAFNCRFLVELLGSMDDERVQFAMSGSLAPGVFKTQEKGFVHVVMPVRVQGEGD